MALTESRTMDVGQKAPDFELINSLDNHLYRLQEMKGKKGTFVLFMCNHCPYVKHIMKLLKELSDQYQPKGIQFIGISSNDVSRYEEDGPEHMRALFKGMKMNFPYLYDENQSVARAYDAQCTPDPYLFDADLKLVYHGQLDSSRPGNDKKANGKDIMAAFDALLNNKKPLKEQKPSIGCSIKWKE